MRRGAFSKEFRDDYYAIITAVETNMELLGYNSEQIFLQTCQFWRNIAKGSNDNILSFLHIKFLLDLGKETQCKTDSLTALEIEDYIYLDRQFVKAQHEFSNLWQQRIRKMSQLRKRNIEECEMQIQKNNLFETNALLRHMDQYIKNSPSASKPKDLALREMEVQKEDFVLHYQEMYNLLIFACLLQKNPELSEFDDINTIPIISSANLYDQVILNEENI